MSRGRFFATPPLCAALLLAFGQARTARASAPDIEPDFGPYCMAGATLTASFPSPIYAIPDNQTDLVAGTVPTVANGTPIKIVVLEININHTFIGDLVIRLSYQDCNTGREIYGTNVLCRPRGTENADNIPCGTDNLDGCDGNLGKSMLDSPQPVSNRYFFSDESPNYMADGVCPLELGPGCYHPSIGADLTGFIGLPHGGCWRLIVSDYKVGNFGSITSWGIWERDPLATATRRSSWGDLKLLYR